VVDVGLQCFIENKQEKSMFMTMSVLPEDTDFTWSDLLQAAGLIRTLLELLGRILRLLHKREAKKPVLDPVRKDYASFLGDRTFAGL
jgi:hypothetical protein